MERLSFRQIFFSFTVHKKKKLSAYANLDLAYFRPTVTVVIPAHNEEGSIEETVRGLHSTLLEEKVDHEILVEVLQVSHP